MRLEKSDRPDSSGRYRNLMMAALAATAFNVSACGPGSDPTETDAGTAGTAGTAGSAGEGGTGGTGAGGTGGVEGGTGGTGGNPCANLPFDGLASKRFEPGETGSFEVALGDSHPDKAYNGTKLTLPSGEVITVPSTVVLRRVKYDNYQTDGYGPVADVSGVRPYVFEAEQVQDENGNCVEKLAAVNAAALSNPAKRPVMESPIGIYASMLKMDNSTSTESMAAFTLTAERTRSELDALYTANSKVDYLMGNSKPVVTASALRDAEGHIVVDLAGTTDESNGSELVLGKLNASASGVTFAAVPGQPGKFRSTAASALTSLNLSVAGLNQSLTDDTAVKSVDVTPPAPVISNLAIDCSSTYNECYSGSLNYPVTFTATDATDCTVTPTVISGAGTPGSSSAVVLNSGSASSTYTSGSDAGDIIELEADCNGPGGTSSPTTIQITLQ